MLYEDALREQVDEAIRQPRARYLITAIIDDDEIDAGETVIGPESDAAECCQAITQQVVASMRDLSVTTEQQDRLRIVIEDVPLLY